MPAKGVAALETGQAFARAHELWKQLGSPSEFLHILRGQDRYHAYRGELDLALRLDQELLALSRQRNNARGVISSLFGFGHNLMFSGKFGPSRLHLEEAVASVALGDSNLHRMFHTDLQAYLGTVLFILGYPDQALARNNAAIAEARGLALRHFWL